MAKRTIQDLILQRLDNVETKLDVIIPVLEGLKVKTAMVGGIAGVVGTAVMTAILSAFK